MKNRDDLCAFLDTVEADIVVLTETWLSAKIPNHELFTCNKVFTCYRADRGQRTGGGVLIAVSDDLQSSVINISTPLEMIWVSIGSNHRRIIVGVCYRPPSFDNTFASALHDALNIVIIRFPSSPVFLLGDFNYPSISWGDVLLRATTSNEANVFVDVCNDFHLHQIVSQPTRTTSSSSNILDLILTTTPNLASPVSHLDGLSDHALLHFLIKSPMHRGIKHAKVIRNYNKANFTAINNELCTFLDTFLCGFSERSVESNWLMFKTKTRELMDRYIPVSTIRVRNGSPWYNQRLKRLNNKKKRLYRKARSSTSALKWENYSVSAATY